LVGPSIIHTCTGFAFILVRIISRNESQLQVSAEMHAMDQSDGEAQRAALGAYQLFFLVSHVT
jgi:hypothetical protein